MRNFFILIFVCITYYCNAQSNAQEINLSGVEITNSTALTLLDNTAAIITSNPDQKEFSVNTENLSKISFDVSPFKSKLTGLEYYGLGKNTADFRRITFNKFIRPLVSGAVNQTDTLTSVSFGISSNVVTIYRQNKTGLTDGYNSFRRTFEEYDKLTDSIMKADFPDIKKTGETAQEYSEKYSEVMKNLKIIDKNDPQRSIRASAFAYELKKPLLMLDVAVAYSISSPYNKIKDIGQDRFSSWATLTVSPLRIINIYCFARYLSDNSVYNPELKNYNGNFKYFDNGGKIELDFKRLSFGYEYIKRNGDGKDYRSVGFVQYKVSKNIYLTGGFGKNFEMESGHDLLTMFGIRWGLNNNDIRDWQ